MTRQERSEASWAWPKILPGVNRLKEPCRPRPGCWRTWPKGSSSRTVREISCIPIRPLTPCSAMSQGNFWASTATILNAYPPEENSRVVRDVVRQVKKNGVWHGEFHNKKKDGTSFISSACISTLKINEKHLYISVQEDITSRKITEQEMARLASFPELNPNPVLEIDGSGNVTYCNPAGLQALEILGVPDEPWRFLPSDWKDLRQSFHESGEVQFYREVVINGGVFAETISFLPEPEAIRIYAWNITLRRQAEEALKQSEERYRSLFQNNHAVMLLIDPETGDIVDANPAACKYYGFSHEDLTAKKIYEFNNLTKDQTFAVTGAGQVRGAAAVLFSTLPGQWRGSGRGGVQRPCGHRCEKAAVFHRPRYYRAPASGGGSGHEGPAFGPEQ